MIFIQILFLSSITLLMFDHANAAAGDLGDACSAGSACTDTTSHVCDPVDSICKVQADGSKTNCLDSDANCPTHSTCSTDTCGCSAGYTVSGAGLCIAGALGDYCLAGGTCTDTTNHVCDPVDFKCKVKADVSSTNCGSSDANCPTHSTCSTSTCDCSAGYSESGGLCTTIGDTCDTDSDCTTGVTNSYCQKYSPCSKGTCTCKSGYSGPVCTTLDYDMTCSTTNDLCNRGKSLECKSTTKCDCSSDSWNSAVSDCTAKKEFSGSCPTNLATDCYTQTNGACTGGVCTCASGYLQVSSGGYQSCREPYVGETCASTCSKVSFSQSVADSSQQTPSCTSNTCGCGTNQERTGKFGSGSCYKYCLTANTDTKANGATCTHHNECAGYACLQCPGDAAAVCYTSPCNGVPGIQASAALLSILLGLFALKVVL